jgi:hypothetical protein
VWLLLEVNQNIIVDISEPSIFNWGFIDPDKPEEVKVLAKMKVKETDNIVSKTLRAIEMRSNKTIRIL